MAISTKAKPKHCWRTETENVNTDDMESRIQFYLEAYRNYIIQCINSDDLLFYKHFSPEIRKRFRNLKSSSQDCISVTSEMLDTIISMEDVPDRFSALLKLFEDEFENEKVSRILKGEKTPTNRKENKEKIQKMCTSEFCKNLNVTEVIPYLIHDKLILEDEGMALKSVAENGKRTLAAFDLLFIVPHRHSHWYTRFLSCLVMSGHTDLAKVVDEKFHDKITKDLSTQSYKGERLIDYRDEEMSLVSGSVCSRLRLVKEAVYTRPTSITDLKVEIPNTKTTRTTEVSPEHERVAEWVKASQEMEEISVNENRFSPKSRKKAKFKKRLSTDRTNSLLAERPLQRARSKRHQTLQVPMNRIAMLQNFMASKARTKAMSVNKSSDDSQSDMSDCSRRASIISSIESVDSLCVDNNWGLQMWVDDKDQSRVNIEMTNILQKISDLDRSSDADETTHAIAENTSTKDEDVETIVHENSLRINRAIQTEAEEKTSCPSFQQLLTVSFLHPVKLSLLVKEYPDIHNVCTILYWISRRTIEYEDYPLSFKAHYISTVIQKAFEAENIDKWIENLLTGRESDGYFEYEDILIREVLEKYEFRETLIFKAIVSEMQRLDTGDGLSSFRIITHILQRNPVSTRETTTLHSNENAKAKNDIASYENSNVEKVKKITCSSSEDTLTSNTCCKMTYNDTKLKNDAFKKHTRNRNDQNEKMAASSTAVNKRKSHEIITAVEKVDCQIGNCITRQSTCNTSKNAVTIEGEKIEEWNCETSNSTAKDTEVKIIFSCETTVTKEEIQKENEVECGNGIDHAAVTKSCGCFSSDELNLLSKSGVSLETLTSNSPDFKVITERKFKGCNVKIVCIHRIDNEKVRLRYTHYKGLLKDNGQGNVQQQLFHGTKYLKAVIEGGFDIMCTEQGVGELYFSSYPLLFENEMKELYPSSDKTFSQEKSQRRILLCNVCLGKTKTETGMCLATRAGVETSSKYNSIGTNDTVDNKTFLKYKVLHADQVWPEYLVTYETLDTNTS